MDALKQFSIPIKGIQNGVHQFDFQLDTAFFEAFEDSIIKEGFFDVKLEVDKRPDMFVLVFSFEGTVKTACDRCLEIIDLPVEGSEQLLVKLAETPSEEAEIVYITPTLTSLNVAKYIYEFINLSLPLIKVYDCENDTPRPCNDNMLDYLEPDDNEEKSNPIWDALKDLNKN